MCLPFSGVVSCDDGSDTGAAGTSLVSSPEDSPFGGLCGDDTRVGSDRVRRSMAEGFSPRVTSTRPAILLTRTRSDMFCPKTNFAPLSVLFVAFFELEGLKRNTSAS